MEIENDPWSGFWKPVIFIFTVAIVSSCSGCFGSDKLTVKQVIAAVKDACDEGGVKDIEFDNDDEPRVKKGSCYQEKIIIAP